MGSTRKRPPEEKEDGEAKPEERKKLEDIHEHFHKGNQKC
jgi:hypothetical protein